MKWESYQASEFAGRQEGTILAHRRKGRVFLDLLQRFADKKKVLDLGCNDGGFSAFLCKHGFDVVGFDLPGVVMHAKRKFPNVRFVGGSAEKNLPFDDESFDAVVASEIIEHVKNDYRFISECSRILREGGTLILSTPNRNYLVHALLRFVGYKWDESKNMHVRTYSSGELKELLHNKFQTVRMFGIPFSFIDSKSRVGWLEKLLPSRLRHTLVAVAKK